MRPSFSFRIIFLTIVVSAICNCQQAGNPPSNTPHELSPQVALSDERPEKTVEQLQSEEGVESEEMTPSMLENKLGVKLYHTKQYPEAIRRLKRAIELDPGNKIAHFNLAQLFMELGQWEEAEKYYVRTIKLDDTHAICHSRAGYAAYKLNKLEAAERRLKRAIKLAPNLSTTHHHYYLGLVYSKMDRFEDAARQFTKSIMLNPKRIISYTHLSNIYFDHEFYDQAAQVLGEALKIVEKCSSDETDLRQRLGVVLAEKQQYKAALTQYERALACDPNKPDLLFSAGWTFALIDDRAKARIYLKRFINQAKNDDKVAPRYIKAARDKLFDLAEIEANQQMNSQRP